MNLSRKNILFIVIGLLMPLAYKEVRDLFYSVIVESGLLLAIPKGIALHLTENTFALDAIFCALFIALSWPIYRWMRREDDPFIPSAQVRPMTVRAGLSCAVIALGMAGVTALWQIVARHLLTDVSVVQESVSEFDSTFATTTPGLAFFLWSLLSIGILGPIVEEIVFRGILFSGLNRLLSATLVAVVSGIYFGVWHGSFVQAVYTAVMGIILGLVYAATRNLWFPVIIHLVNNLLSTLPPSLEQNETVVLALIVLRFVAIIPMIIIVVKLVRGSSLMTLRTGRELADAPTAATATI